MVRLGKEHSSAMSQQREIMSQTYNYQQCVNSSKISLSKTTIKHHLCIQHQKKT